MDTPSLAGSPAAFLGDDVLLSTEVARTLFHGVAAAAPVVDVHNHLPPADIVGDRVRETLTDLWLGDDHYKWRAMRQAGEPEHLVTGPADPWDRFSAWARTVPRTVRNPLYVWTHLELQRVFGIDLPLHPGTAREIWAEANRQLPHWSAQRLLAHFAVTAVATTDDPADPLPHHERHAATVAAGTGGAPTTAMVPTFRPDAAHRLLDDPAAWNAWIDRLETTTGVAVDDLGSLLGALTRSFRAAAALGGRASDHGLACVPDRVREPGQADRVVRSARRGRPADDAEREGVLLEVVTLAARLAFEHDSVLQLHVGPLRNASPRLLATVGRDAGGDAMNDERQGPGLARLLADLEAAGTLPRTILYNLNPADNALFATLAGAFSRPGVASLVQWGPPWWFNDHEGGMRRHLDDLGQIGQLAGFVGMLTDSRSILSMTRHELFRRTLCDVLGRDVAAGTIPGDVAWLSTMVRDLCVDNAVAWFGFPAGWARRP